MRPLPLAVWACIVWRVCLRDLSMGIWLLVALSSYCRPGEMMNLRRGDVMPPSTAGNRCWTMIICPSERPDRTKTGSSDDSIALDSPWLPNRSVPLKLRTAGDQKAPF